MGGVASVTMHLQLSYLSVPGRAFRMLCHRKTDRRHRLLKIWRIFKDFFHVLLEIFHNHTSENTHTVRTALSHSNGYY